MTDNADTCPECKGLGYFPGGPIYDAAGGLMDSMDNEPCRACGGTGKQSGFQTEENEK